MVNAILDSDVTRHETCAVQVLSTGRLPGWKRMPLLPFHGSNQPAGSMQIFHEGTTAHSHARLDVDPP